MSDFLSNMNAYYRNYTILLVLLVTFLIFKDSLTMKSLVPKMFLLYLCISVVAREPKNQTQKKHPNIFFAYSYFVFILSIVNSSFVSSSSLYWRTKNLLRLCSTFYPLLFVYQHQKQLLRAGAHPLTTFLK